MFTTRWKSSCSGAPGLRQSFRPVLEELENRWVLSPITVTLQGHAEWSDGHKPHPIPSAMVAIISTTANETLIATTETQANGNYQQKITFDPLNGFPKVYSVVYAQSIYDQVVRSVGDPVGVSLASSEIVLTTSSDQVLPKLTATGDAAAAFSVHSAVILAKQYVEDVLRFYPGQAKVILYSNGGNKDDLSHFDPKTFYLWIENADDFDWDTIDHEYGHYLENTNHFGYSNDGIGHDFLKHNLVGGVNEAFSEGWADYFAVVARQWEGKRPYAFGVGLAGVAHTVAAVPGLGEDDELSVAGSLYHLAYGDRGLYVGDKVLFDDLKTSKALNIGAAWNAIAGPLSTKDQTILGKLLGWERIAPVETGPADFVMIDQNSLPTFEWNTNGAGVALGPYYLNSFQLVFYTSDFGTNVGTIPVSPDTSFLYISSPSTITFKPAPVLWFNIIKGHSTLRWVVEGKNTAHSTPGGSSPLDYYWSGARTIKICQQMGSYGLGGSTQGASYGPGWGHSRSKGQNCGQNSGTGLNGLEFGGGFGF
jgi:hypothetical protein